jgi:hypothetical protein
MQIIPDALRLLELLLERRISLQRVFPRASFMATGETDAKLSLWQRLIFLAVFVGRLERGTRLHQVFGQVVQTFLEHRADPYLQISVVRELHSLELERSDSSSKLGETSTFKLTLGKQKDAYKIKSKVEPGNSVFEFIVEKGGETSLHDLIEFWGFNNANALLKLFDASMHLSSE